MSSRTSSPDLQSDTPIDGGFGVNCANAAVTVVQAAHRSRIVLYLTNPSDTDMWIGLGKDPVATGGSETGIFLAKTGGSMVIDNWTGDVRVAHAGAAPKRITGAVV